MLKECELILRCLEATERFSVGIGLIRFAPHKISLIQHADGWKGQIQGPVKRHCSNARGDRECWNQDGGDGEGAVETDMGNGSDMT